MKSKIYVNKPSEKAIHYDENDVQYYGYLQDKLSRLLAELKLPPWPLDPNDMAEFAEQLIEPALIKKAKEDLYAEGILTGLLIGTLDVSGDLDLDDDYD